jgi:hypothetical protein
LSAGTNYLSAEYRAPGPPAPNPQNGQIIHYGGALDIGGARPIETVAGQTIADADIEIPKRPAGQSIDMSRGDFESEHIPPARLTVPPAAVEGTVTDAATREPVAGARLSAGLNHRRDHRR